MTDLTNMTETTLTRRTVLAGGAAVTLTALSASAGWTQASVEGVATRKVGDAELIGFLDGRIMLPTSLLSGATPEDLAELVEGEAVNGYVNAYAVRSGGELAMIDAGAGGLIPTAGNLSRLMDEAGIKPADVSTFYATHLHPDHIGGLVGDGALAFPNAQMVVHEQERAFWTNDEIMAQAGEANQAFFQAARAALQSFGDRVTAFTGEEVPGPLTAMELFGHTPGHVGYTMSDGDESLLVWGDIIHAPQVQFPRPSVTIAFDTDASAAEATRKRVLDMVATDKTPVAGMHLAFPGTGTVVKQGDGYALEG